MKKTTYRLVYDLSQTLGEHTRIVKIHLLKMKKDLEAVRNQACLTLEKTGVGCHVGFHGKSGNDKRKTGRSSLNHISVKSSKTTRNRNDTVMEILIAKEILGIYLN